MKAFSRELSLETHDKRELVDLTAGVAEAVKESGVKGGICVVYSMHTTGAIIINENEEGLLRDVLVKVAEDFPRRGTWLHNLVDDNAQSHLAGAYLGPSVTVPVEGGSLTLGEFQSVFFLELDGPRPERKVIVEIVGE
ncbi:MAG: secondary thiamine-phosphate synthase enzyme YjbQ [Conexivisphaerales archaeon]